MKKINLIILSLLVAILLPSKVNADSATIGINCSKVTVGETVTCKISATSGDNINGIEGKISISGGASISSVSKDSAWSGDFTSSDFSLYIDSPKTATFSLGTITLKGVTAGTATLTISNVSIIGGDFNSYPCSSKSQTITVAAQTTVSTTKSTTTTTKSTTTTTRYTGPTTTTSTKRTTTTTDKKNTTTTTRYTGPTTTTSTKRITNSAGEVISPGEYDPYNTSTTKYSGEHGDSPELSTTSIIPLYLTSVTVDGFEVKYDSGRYYVTVNYDTEAVTVNATAIEGVTIIGTGQRTLTYGKNVVELILRNETLQTFSTQVIITRPLDTNEYDTSLRSLKVVDYELKFDKNQKEYTITVPSSVKELYIIAESNSVDTIVTGDGLQTLKSGKNDIYIKVFYGDITSSEYVIHVKRSNMSTILWCIIGVLGAGLIGLSAYFFVEKQRIKQVAAEEKTKIIAEANRTIAANQDTISVNGKSVIGIGRNTVVPTKVVNTKQPTNPVAVASIQPKEIKNVQMSSSSPQPQVKVIKRTVVPTPQQVTQVSKNYSDDDVVITDIN